MKKHIVLVIALLLLSFIFVSCGVSSGEKTSSGSTSGASTTKVATEPAVDKGGIVVSKPVEKGTVYAYLEVKKDSNGRYVAYFHVKNPTDSTYEYTSNNGCVVDWKVFQKVGDSWSLIFPKRPPICTQQIVVVQVKPGEDKVITTGVFPVLDKPGTYLIEGSMGTLKAQQIIEVK